MALATQFGPQPFTDPQPPRFYECGTCGHMHPINWNGDCRDDNNRFTCAELDEKYGENNWKEVDSPALTWTEDFDLGETPVIFRKSKGEVTAVFPCEPATMEGRTMTCYAHMGQHSSCDLGWYNTTKAAKPEDYANLKRELESPPYGYKLKVYQRLNKHLRAKFDAELQRLRSR